MEFKTSLESFNIENLNIDLKEFEKTETLIWEFHKSNRLSELYTDVKNRNLNFAQFVSLYKDFYEEYEKIKEDILSKYPQVNLVGFENNYHIISDLLDNISNLLGEQQNELNISENLIDVLKRESILNGHKLNPNESQFTSMIKELIISINSKEHVENLGGSVEVTKTEETFLKTQEVLDKTLEPVESIKPEDEVKFQEPEKEALQTQNLQPIPQKEMVEESIASEVQSQSKVASEEEEEVDSENLYEVGITDEKPVKQDIIENVSDENALLDQIIKDYLSYQDAIEVEDEEKNEIMQKQLNSPSAKRYAKVLLELKDQSLMPKVESVVREIFAKTITQLSSYEIDPNPLTYSASWAYWDLAKQIYYLRHPNQSNSNYLLANPLEDESKVQEIIDRHVGWEVYRQMDSGKLDNFLNKNRHPIYGKRVIDVMIHKANHKNEHMPSYKLAELGKNVRLGLSETEN